MLTARSEGQGDHSVSIIIPAYNCAAQLESCLQSICLSSRRPLECIVVDDASSDHSAEIASRYGAQVVRNERNRGPAHCRNLGARFATGKVLLFLDADVCAKPDVVERVVSILSA